MLIRSEFDIQFQLHAPVAMVAMLHVHPSLDAQLRQPDTVHIEQMNGTVATPIKSESYLDCFGNRCDRFLAPQGLIRLHGMNVIEHSGHPDTIETAAIQHPIEELPTETLQFLLSSRYCPVDQLSHAATDLFSHTSTGWARAIAIRDWVHNHVAFDYTKARPTKTALDVFTERVGVCRDFQHLAITLTRAMNIPARYVTGQLGDIRWPYSGAGDFSAWYEVYLSGRWWTMDARHNEPRVGRILMATGRDATDVALTTSFGIADLRHFYVESNEILPDGTKVPVPGAPAAHAVATPQRGPVSAKPQAPQMNAGAA
jgi:transglutaminase-like putative cysteine protease